jgi:hypothetical protein
VTTLAQVPTASEASAAPMTQTGGRLRLALGSGAGFVACILVGNALTGSASAEGSTVESLAAQATSVPARAGLALELVGFCLLLVFVAALGHLGRGRVGGQVAVVGGIVLAAVKLASGGALLGALHEREALEESTAAGLVASNDAAFVLSWLPFGLLVLGTAVTMLAIGRIGRVAAGLGVVLGALTVALGVAGSVEPDLAVPIPFLLGLLWVAVTSVRLAVQRAR